MSQLIVLYPGGECSRASTAIAHKAHDLLHPLGWKERPVVRERGMLLDQALKGERVPGREAGEEWFESGRQCGKAVCAVPEEIEPHTSAG